MSNKVKVISLYGGPGTGKSTTASLVFGMLKLNGVNCEYVQEYAKDKAWEHGKNFIETPLVFQAQEYIFGKQHYRFRRCAQTVEMIVTDSPLLLGHIYTPQDFCMPALHDTIDQAYNMYDNLDVMLRRCKPFNPDGRLHTEEKAKELDVEIEDMLSSKGIVRQVILADQSAATEVIRAINKRWNLDLIPYELMPV